MWGMWGLITHKKSKWIQYVFPKILKTCRFGYFGYLGILGILIFWFNAWTHLLRIAASIPGTLGGPFASKKLRKLNKLLLRTCRFVILYTFILCACPDIPLRNHQKRQYQFVENIDVYLHAKTQLHLQLLSWDLHFRESCNLIGRKHFGP